MVAWRDGWPTSRALSHWYGASVSSRAHALRGRRGRVGGFGSWDAGAAVSVPFDQEDRWRLDGRLRHKPPRIRRGRTGAERRAGAGGVLTGNSQHGTRGPTVDASVYSSKFHIKIPLIRLTIFRDETPITLRVTLAFRM